MEKVGFVGLGIMGAAMAKHLLAADYGLVVHNRTQGQGRRACKARSRGRRLA